MVKLGYICEDNLGQQWQAVTEQRNWRTPEQLQYVLIEILPPLPEGAKTPLRVRRAGLVGSDGTDFKVLNKASTATRIIATQPPPADQNLAFEQVVEVQ